VVERQRRRDANDKAKNGERCPGDGQRCFTGLSHNQNDSGRAVVDGRFCHRRYVIHGIDRKH
jgi:hypothetical protein